jgi:hypothetical protein
MIWIFYNLPDNAILNAPALKIQCKNRIARIRAAGFPPPRTTQFIQLLNSSSTASWFNTLPCPPKYRLNYLSPNVNRASSLPKNCPLIRTP